MGILGFLAALPAILALTGFVLFLVLRSHGSDETTKRLLQKVRNRDPSVIGKYPAKLSEPALAQLLVRDQEFRKVIGEHDFALLQQVLRNRFVLSLVVYALCGILFLAGVAMFVWVAMRPEPLRVSNVTIANQTPESHGILVDLDPLVITWDASGHSSDADLWMENVDTLVRSAMIRSAATDREATLTPEQYRPVLAERRHRGVNRVRAVVSWQDGTAKSATTDLHVGTTITVVGFPERLKIIARIDNEPIPFHDFETKVLLWRRRPSEVTTYGGLIRYGSNDFPLVEPDRIDWATIKGAYLGPDDPSIVRFEFLGLADQASEQ